MEEQLNINDMLQSEARKMGASSKDAKRAMKQIQSGKVMSQVAPELQEMFMGMNPTMSPRDRLRQKLQRMRNGRSAASVKDRRFKEMKEKVYKEREEREKTAAQKKKTAARRRKNHRRKLREIEAKLGTISHQMYMECVGRSKDEYPDNETGRCQRNRDNNIIEIYQKQQDFSKEVDMGDLDDL